MKTFTICNLLDYLKGLDLVNKPVQFLSPAILVVLIPKVKKATGSCAAVEDKFIALLAASVITYNKTNPGLQ